MKSIYRILKCFFLFLIVFVVCIEVASCVYIRFINSNIPLPTYSLVNAESSFWVDINPYFGIWHAPNSSYMHNKQCATVYYKANSHGMRDPERSLKSDKPRVAVLGDSFVEGYIIEDGKRMTDILEKKYGTEFLNFGTSGGFGPLQEWLQYKTMVKNFDHDAIILGILPNNDFSDIFRNDFNKRYRRAYLKGEHPDFSVAYTQDQMPEANRSDLLKSFDHTLREWSHAYRIARYLDSFDLKNMDFRARWLSNFEREEKRKPLHSMYYDFTAKDWNGLKFCLTKLAEETGDKPFLLFTIPRYSDFSRYDGTEPPLSAKLRELSNSLRITYVDLLPSMDAYTENPAQYFLICDPHWNNFGNEVASDILSPYVEKLLETAQSKQK